jgi:flagellar export protein FliJ
MAFKFSLATVLRLREIAEDREERLLMQIRHQMAQSHQELAELDARCIAVIAQRESELTSQIPATELQDSYMQMSVLEERKKSTREHLMKLETLRVQQMKVYETAHRDREVIEQIREEKLEHFRRDQVRREQHDMDDNFSARKARR